MGSSTGVSWTGVCKAAVLASSIDLCKSGNTRLSIIADKNASSWVSWTVLGGPEGLDDGRGLESPRTLEGSFPALMLGEGVSAIWQHGRVYKVCNLWVSWFGLDWLENSSDGEVSESLRVFSGSFPSLIPGKAMSSLAAQNDEG